MHDVIVGMDDLDASIIQKSLKPDFSAGVITQAASIQLMELMIASS